MEQLARPALPAVVLPLPGLLQTVDAFCVRLPVPVASFYTHTRACWRDAPEVSPSTAPTLLPGFDLQALRPLLTKASTPARGPGFPPGLRSLSLCVCVCFVPRGRPLAGKRRCG